jgi:hypothetical protein
MAKVKRKIGKPVQKKLPVESPDRIPEGQATLEDYEKMSTKIDISELTSSEVPVEEPLCEVDNVKSEESKLPFISDPEPSKLSDELPELPFEELAAPIVDYDTLKTITLTPETTVSPTDMRNIMFYIEENRKLLEENKKLKNDKIDMEKQISRLNMISVSLKSQLDRMVNDRRLPPHTYSPNTYVDCGVVNPITGQQVVKPQIRRDMNGYESWC